jgi:hypothetical protein
MVLVFVSSLLLKRRSLAFFQFRWSQTLDALPPLTDYKILTVHTSNCEKNGTQKNHGAAGRPGTVAAAACL